MQFSLVIPAFNEAERIGPTLEKVLAYLGAQSYASEVVVVSDGSTDDTVQKAQAYSGGAVPVRVVALVQNRGKGYAVREGMWRHATGALRLFYDADGSTPIEEVGKVWPYIEQGAQVVIGSRALPRSDVAVRQQVLRETLGRINNLILRAVGLTVFHDTQCGFKAFTSGACEIVFPRQTVDGFGFDAELLHIAELYHLRIEEVPVRWENSPHSKVHPVRDSIRMLRDLLKVRANSVRGHYN